MDKIIMEIVEGIPKRLKEARVGRGMTQEDVARQMSVSRSLISQYESGSTAISIPHLLNLARILDVSPTKLMGLSVRSISSFPPSIVAVVEMMEDLSPGDRSVIFRLVKALAQE